METKHNPGPWEDHSGFSIWATDENGNDMRIANVDRSQIGRQSNIKQIEANARLIAAAPEMLEALQTWLKFWDDMPKGQLGKIVCNIGLLNDAFMQTEAAIRKATK